MIKFSLKKYCLDLVFKGVSGCFSISFKTYINFQDQEIQVNTVCSEHFEDDCFKFEERTRGVRDGASPSLFLGSTRSYVKKEI